MHKPVLPGVGGREHSIGKDAVVDRSGLEEKSRRPLRRGNGDESDYSSRVGEQTISRRGRLIRGL